MEEKERKRYPSDLTDEQWEEIVPLYTGMRNCTWNKRKLTDAVLYSIDSGCKWRQLPHDFPPYTVHSFYRRARISGLGDGSLIGHNVVLATINHDLDPAMNRKNLYAPIKIGAHIWIGSTITSNFSAILEQDGETFGAR